MTEVERSGLEKAAERLVEQVLRVGIDGAGPVKGAVVVAEENLERARGDAEFAEKRLIATHIRLAATSGFVTGAGGLIASIVTIPTGIAGLYVISTRMVAGIAHLRGYDVGSEDVRSAILVSLLGSGAAAALGGVGIEIGQKSALAAVRRVPGRALINQQACRVSIDHESGREGQHQPHKDGAAGRRSDRSHCRRFELPGDRSVRATRVSARAWFGRFFLKRTQL